MWEYLRPMWLVLVGCMYSPVCLAVDTTAVPTPTPSTPPGPAQGEDVLTRPIDRGMKPVYTMTNFFLETIINPPSLARLAEKVDLTDWDAVVASLQNNWQMWFQHHYGYLICVVFGVAYALAMIITLICICCCRCKDKCGAKPKERDDKNTGHDRRCCAALLLIVLVPIMLGTVALFIANQLTYEETRPTGMTAAVTDSLNRLKFYQDNTAQSLENAIGEGFDRDINRMLGELNRMPENSQSIVGHNTTSLPLLESLQVFTNGLNATGSSLVHIDNLTEDLVEYSSDLTNQTEDLKLHMERGLASCNATNVLCEMALQMAGQLEVQIDYSGALGLMAQAADAVTNVTSGDDTIYDGLPVAWSEYDKVLQALNSSLFDEIQDIVHITDTLNGEVQDFVNFTVVRLRSVSLDDARVFVNYTIEPWVKRAGDIHYYTCIAIGCILVILVFLFLTSLSYGICGERAGKDAECCNRGNGASLLVTTAYLVFALAWLLMLAASVLIVLGGIAHTDLCRHMVKMEDQEVLQVFDNIIQANIDLMNISAVELYQNCRENEAIYTAASMDEWGKEYNVSYLLDLNIYGIPDQLKELSNMNFSIGSILLLNEHIETSLEILGDGFSTLNFTIYHEQLTKNITSISLEDFSVFLLECAQNTTSPPELSDLFLQYSNLTKELHNDLVVSLTQMQTFLQNNITLVETFLDILDPTQFMNDLRSAESSIDSSILTKAVELSSMDIFRQMEGMTRETETSVREDIGQCEPLYSAGADGVTAACIKFLYPFNAFWFSLGWCLFFFIFTIPIAMILAGYYERTEKYSKLAELGLYFDPSDPTVPRQSVHRKKPKKAGRVPPALPANGASDFEMLDMNHYARSPIDSPGLDSGINDAYLPDEDEDGGFVSYHSQPRHERQLSTRRTDDERRRNRDATPSQSHNNDRAERHRHEYHNPAYRPTSEAHIYDSPLPTEEGPGPYRRYDNGARSPSRYDQTGPAMQAPVPHMIRLESNSRDPSFLNSAYF